MPGSSSGACARSAGSSPEHRVHQFDRGPVLDRHVSAAAGTARSRFACLDMRAQRLTGDVGHGEYVHIRESDQQLAEARTLEFHRCSPELDDVENRQVRRASVSHQGPPTPRSFPKRQQSPRSRPRTSRCGAGPVQVARVSTSSRSGLSAASHLARDPRRPVADRHRRANTLPSRRSASADAGREEELTSRWRPRPICQRSS